MTFDQIVAMARGTRFSTGQVTDLGVHLNARLGELLALEDWEFLHTENTVTLNAATVALPTDAGLPEELLLDDDGDPLDFLSVSEFRQTFLGDTNPGRPEAFAVLGSNLLIGPTPDASYAATLVSRADAAELSGSDVPVTPTWTHPGLAAGTAARMLLFENDPTGVPLEQAFQQTVDAMRRRCLTPGRGRKLRQMPRDPLGC